MRKAHRLRSWLFTAICLVLQACGGTGSANRQVSCQLATFQSCSAESSGGHLSINLKDVKPSQEFIVVLQSRAPARLNEKFQIVTDLSTNQSSSEISGHERDLRSRVLAQALPLIHTGSIHFNVPAPANLYVPLYNLNARDYYVPVKGDYELVIDGKLMPFKIRDSLNPEVSGRTSQFIPIAHSPGLYSIWLDSTTGENPEDYDLSLAAIDDAIVKMVSVLGRPVQVNPAKGREVKILITYIQGGEGIALGTFNFLDRHLKYKGHLIPDSNFDQIIYVSPHLRGEQLASTIAHEFTHLRRYDATDIIPLGGNAEDLDATKHLPQEYASLGEGMAHNLEELTGMYQNAYTNTLRFLLKPGGVAWALEAAWDDRQQNAAARGINISAVQHIYALHKAPLDLDHPKTKALTQSMVLSEDIGYKNLAKLVNKTEIELFESFFRGYSLALFQSGMANEFLPPRVIENEVSRGVEIVDRWTEPEDWSYLDGSSFHPLQAEIPLLRRSQSFPMRPSTIQVFRFIAPLDTESEIKIVGATQDSPFAFFLTRVQ